MINCNKYFREILFADVLSFCVWNIVMENLGSLAAVERVTIVRDN